MNPPDLTRPRPTPADSQSLNFLQAIHSIDRTTHEPPPDLTRPRPTQADSCPPLRGEGAAGPPYGAGTTNKTERCPPPREGSAARPPYRGGHHKHGEPRAARPTSKYHLKGGSGSPNRLGGWAFEGWRGPALAFDMTGGYTGRTVLRWSRSRGGTSALRSRVGTVRFLRQKSPGRRT